MRRRPAAAGALLLAALLLLPSSAPVYGQGRTPRDTLVVAQGFDPRCLSPLFGTAQQDKNISGQVVERLISFTPDMTGYLPELATRWQRTAPDTIRLHLRRNVRFHNGEPFNADSAKWSIDQLVRSPAYAFFVSYLAGAEVVDAATIDVKAKGPTSERLMLTAIALGSFMYPQQYTQQVGMLQGFCQRPVGTGPFKFVEWVKDDRVVFEANADYWGGAPQVRRLVFRPIPEGAARIAALQAGDIDLSIDIPLDAWDRVTKDANLRTYWIRGIRMFRLGLSQKWEGPLKDKRVRQAFRHAVDAQSLVRNLFGGRARLLPSHSLVPEVYGAPGDGKPNTYDPDRARRMLAEAGFPNGFAFTFKYPIGRFAQDREASEAIAAQLQRVGLRPRMVSLEPGEFLTQLSRLELRDIYFSGSLPPPDVHYVYTQYLCNFRYSYWCSAEFDALHARAAASPQDTDRVRIYKQMTDILEDDPNGVALYAPYDLYATRRGVAGWRPTKEQWLNFAKVRKTE
jgi:peptide/nickel transport system substrate-binding protein